MEDLETIINKVDLADIAASMHNVLYSEKQNTFLTSAV